ncbi:hypothetical protein N7492_003685 [Penicillium capsulatum]|uniref:Cytochrome oxidase c assembly-domain-containing protein n=1 Tax=Penicillium capsulatum TaxID=69766 RepID=A0A9W9LWU1_9EURO|nr:hypothetical protein N7492_003685 [Penicillium capsulatum]KAJ6121734.1 hypothetical protein N7512_004199 [Penicillium capsulatum]
MSRSAADATRFTATGPYASSKPNGTPYELPESTTKNASTSQSQKMAGPTGPGGKPETPKQKVERLRAQARAARMAQSASGMDRWIEVGRRVANKTHKGMVYSLIVASGICGVLTVYSMVSLTLYNRRQRTLWLERELATLNEARIAQANGSATTDQLELIKKEEIAEIVKRNREEEKAQKPWAKAKRYLFDKLNAEDTGAAVTASATPVESTQPGVSSIVDATNAKNAFDAAAAKTASPMPGQLDVMAENAERAAKEKSRGWTSWLTGR